MTGTNLKSHDNTKARLFRFSLEMTAALGLSALLPFLAHIIGAPGQVYLPIYTVVLLSGLYWKDWKPMILAPLVPLLNYLITGMPAMMPFPAFWVLVVELLALAGAAYLLQRFRLSPWFAIPMVLLLARSASLLLLPVFPVVSWDWWLEHLRVSLPGIFLNLALAYAVYWGQRGREKGQVKASE